MSKRWILALFIATLFCTVQAQSSADGYMTVSSQQQATWTRNFNPFVADNRFPTNNGIYEPSMIYNTVKGELVPWLATDYAWGNGDKTLTLTYRNDVKWSDGKPFTAKDVAYTSILRTHLRAGAPESKGMSKGGVDFRASGVKV